MKGLDAIAKELGKYLSKPERNYELESQLIELGRTTIEEAFRTKETENITFNQHDAYVYALYFNGEMIKAGKLKQMAKEPAELDNGEEFWGSPEAEALARRYNAPKNGYALLIANAAPYSFKHEEEQGRDIIYQVIDRLADFASDYEYADIILESFI